MTSASRVLSFVRGYLARRGVAPSVREISEAVSLAPSTVHRILDDLESRGELVRLRGVARGLIVDVESRTAATREREEYLYELAISFEYASAHEVEFIPDYHELDEPLRHALRAAAFKGVAIGLRNALGLADEE